MAPTTPYVLKWGVMGTGHIARNFAKDLLTDPKVRGMQDIKHQIVAVASSSAAQQAVTFCKEVQIPDASQVSTYGSYAELVADPEVAIVYVATPVSHHFQNVMLALTAGKHVLCEKPFTLTRAQAKSLVETATQRQLFLMEAVWTRFFPISEKVQELVSAGAIGTVCRVIADTSINRSKPDGKLDYEDASRILNPSLGGGAMLDLGIYSLTWILQILFHLQPDRQKGTETPTIIAASSNTYHTGVDETTSFILQFPGHNTMGIGMTTLRVGAGVDYDFTGGAAVKVQGSLGEIQVCGPPFRPSHLRLIRADGRGVETSHYPVPQDASRGGWGRGLFWEADECARCVRDGRLQSDVLPLDETVLSAEIMEEVLRKGGVHHPGDITSHVFDPDSPLNRSRA